MATTADTDDRRHRGRRVPSNARVTLLVGSGGRTVGYDADLVDASMWGLRLKAKAPLSPRDEVRVVPKEDQYVVRGRVVWVSSPRDVEHREVGIEFPSPCPTSFWKA
jgi:hypothetical protein